VDIADYDFRTPLHVAVSLGNIEMVKFLLSLNVPASPIDRWGVTPLWNAICEGKKDIAQVLRSHGGEIKQSSQKVTSDTCLSTVNLLLVLAPAATSHSYFKVASFLCSLASSSSALPLLLSVLDCGGFEVSSADYVSNTQQPARFSMFRLTLSALPGRSNRFARGSGVQQFCSRGCFDEQRLTAGLEGQVSHSCTRRGTVCKTLVLCRHLSL